MNTKFLKELAEILDSTGVAEIEIKRWGTYIRLSKTPSGVVVSSMPQVSVNPTPVSAPVPPSPSSSASVSPPEQEAVEEREVGEEKEEKRRENLVAIKSPIVGTFYRAPAPDAPPFVEVGDIVKPGQTVCIVEAMKVMNEIEAEVEGKVVDVLVQNAQPVEYGQELFLIEPL